MPGRRQQRALINGLRSIEHRAPRRVNPLAQARLGRYLDNAASLRPQALEERSLVFEPFLLEQLQLLIVFLRQFRRVVQLPYVQEGRVAAPQEVDEVRCR